MTWLRSVQGKDECSLTSITQCLPWVPPAPIDQCQGPCVLEYCLSIVTTIVILLKLFIKSYVCMLWERGEHVVAYV